MADFPGSAWLAAAAVFAIGFAVIVLATRVKTIWARDPYRLVMLMDRLGVELEPSPAGIDPGEVDQAFASCRRCHNGDICSAWLYTRGHADSHLAFCPNAGFIRRMQRLAATPAILGSTSRGAR